MFEKVLLVENDPNVRDLITYILEDEGMKVVQLTTPEDLDAVAQSAPDLALVDEWTSGGPGHRLCLRIKQNPRMSHIPMIIMSTALHIEEIAAHCRADAYIRKPFDLNELLEKVREKIRRLSSNR
jgi:two-component system phosphate regulon response regulator PhoB